MIAATSVVHAAELKKNRFAFGINPMVAVVVDRDPAYTGQYIDYQDAPLAMATLQADFGYRIKQNIFGVYGQWGAFRYECGGGYGYPVRDALGADGSDANYQERCDGNTVRGGFRFSRLVERVDETSMGVHYAISIGYQRHDNRMKMIHDGLGRDNLTHVHESYRIVHVRSGLEYAIEGGIDWPIGRSVFLGPILGFNLSQDQFVTAPAREDKSPAHARHVWFVAGMRFSYR